MVNYYFLMHCKGINYKSLLIFKFIVSSTILSFNPNITRKTTKIPKPTYVLTYLLTDILGHLQPRLKPPAILIKRTQDIVNMCRCVYVCAYVEMYRLIFHYKHWLFTSMSTAYPFPVCAKQTHTHTHTPIHLKHRCFL